jgi:hypothetical protein
LSDVVHALLPNAGDQIMAADSVSDALDSFPQDLRMGAQTELHGGFRRIDQTVQQGHVEAALKVAQAVATELTSDNRLGALLGTCATDDDRGNDQACVADFLRRAGRLIDRKPLSDEDVAFYQDVYGAQRVDRAALADVLTTMLAGPRFLYRVEHGTENLGGEVYRLSSVELANRLSLQLWNSAPDEALIAMADQGMLDDEDGYRQAVDYVLGDPRAAAGIEEFFREWLSVEDLLEIDRFNGTPLFDAVRGDFLPLPETRQNMIEEVVRSGSYYMRQGGTFTDLFTNTKSFATTPDIAQIYGVKAWSGQGEPPDFAEPERIGVLGRAALLATGSPETRPIMKGVVLRTVVLCDNVPPPPANAMALAQEAESTLPQMLSTRERLAAITEVPGSACAGCHATMINGLGVVTENFDSLGRLRAEQKVFDSAGKMLGVAAVDTTSTPRVAFDDTQQISTLRELVSLILASNKPYDCFARRYYRYMFERPDDSGDGCAVRNISEQLIEGRSLRDVVASVVFRNEFKQRRFE